MKKFISLLLIILVTTLIIITENTQAQAQETKLEFNKQELIELLVAISPKVIYVSPEYRQHNPLNMRITSFSFSSPPSKNKSIREWFKEAEPEPENFTILKIIVESYSAGIGLTFIYIPK